MTVSGFSKRTAAAVFLLSCSALLFQVAQTRLFSATLGYHLTFVAVSIALLGVGAGAAAATLVDRRSNAPSTSRLAAFASRVVLLADGAVVRDGDVSQVITPELVAQVFGPGLRVIAHDGRPFVIPEPAALLERHARAG